MGTVVTLHIEQCEVKGRRLRELLTAATTMLHEHDEMFSTWMPDSPMSRLRRGELDRDELGPAMEEVLEQCEKARSLTGGWFDPFSAPGGVDPTGLVKGWSAEQVRSLLREGGVSSAMVNAGGDIACLGTPVSGGSWKIGVRHPWREDAFACVLEVERAIATSGEYERGRHLYDPVGLKGERPVSVSVTGPSLTFADAFATAIAVGGEVALSKITEVDGYDAYLIRSDGTEIATAGIHFAEASA